MRRSDPLSAPICPPALILSRQNLPILDRGRFAPADGVRRGGYILAREEGELSVMLIASGSEVHPALSARDLLQQEGIGTRLVALCSWEIFEAQESSYREEVLPPSCKARIAVEAAAQLGWERYAGPEGVILGMTGFGASAPGGEVLKHFGFTAENIAARARALLSVLASGGRE